MEYLEDIAIAIKTIGVFLIGYWICRIHQQDKEHNT